MATTQHYLWASGHFLLLISTLRNLFMWMTFKGVSAWWYKASFTGALISYAIVCQKSLGTPQPNGAWLRRALIDENVQYFLLAFFWWSSKPITLTLLPYAIFSVFHALTFIRTTLMPQFLPPGPPTSANGAPQPHPLAKKLQSWVKSNYDAAMRVVAYTELVILVRVVLGALTFQNSLLSPVMYAHFIRQRYYHSAFTREALTVTNRYIDGFVRKPGNPPMMITIWEKVQMLAGRWAGSTLAPNAAPPRRDRVFIMSDVLDAMSSPIYNFFNGILTAILGLFQAILSIITNAVSFATSTITTIITYCTEHIVALIVIGVLIALWSRGRIRL